MDVLILFDDTRILTDGIYKEFCNATMPNNDIKDLVIANPYVDIETGMNFFSSERKGGRRTTVLI